jgi:hypothetical protein
VVLPGLLKDGRQFGQNPSNVLPACHREARAHFAGRLSRGRDDHLRMNLACTQQAHRRLPKRLHRHLHLPLEVPLFVPPCSPSSPVPEPTDGAGARTTYPAGVGLG